jgi:hypothetical protein
MHVLRICHHQLYNPAKKNLPFQAKCEINIRYHCLVFLICSNDQCCGAALLLCGSGPGKQKFTWHWPY